MRNLSSMMETVSNLIIPPSESWALSPPTAPSSSSDQKARAHVEKTWPRATQSGTAVFLLKNVGDTSKSFNIWSKPYTNIRSNTSIVSNILLTLLYSYFKEISAITSRSSTKTCASAASGSTLASVESLVFFLSYVLLKLVML